MKKQDDENGQIFQKTFEKTARITSFIGRAGDWAKHIASKTKGGIAAKSGVNTDYLKSLGKVVKPVKTKTTGLSAHGQLKTTKMAPGYLYRREGIGTNVPRFRAPTKPGHKEKLL